MQPKQFWTKTLKVILVLFLIGGTIGFLIDAIITHIWWIAPVGWIATFFSAAGIGTLIEISENIAARLESENLRESNLSVNTDDPYDMLRNNSTGDSFNEAEDDDPYSILGYSSNNSSKNTNPQKPVTYEKKDYWVCPACGEFNDLSATICKRCDKQVWVCPKCGEANDFDHKSCSKCDWKA